MKFFPIDGSLPVQYCSMVNYLTDMSVVLAKTPLFDSQTGIGIQLYVMQGIETSLRLWLDMAK